MQIWPAIDIRGGKCVRLAQGDYAQETVYGSDPADMAHRFAMDGASGLHIVDLDGARSGNPENYNAIASIVSEIEIPCQVGGGIRDEKTIAKLIDLGIQRLIIGTKAINDPEWLAQMCRKYPEHLLVGIDARQGMVATEGWEKTSSVSAVELVKNLSSLTLAGIIFTDISRDGMLSGPNFSEVNHVVDIAGIPVIASGGITTTDDVSSLAQMGASGAVIGKSLYEGRITIPEAVQAASLSTSNQSSNLS